MVPLPAREVEQNALVAQMLRLGLEQPIDRAPSAEFTSAFAALRTMALVDASAERIVKQLAALLKSSTGLALGKCLIAMSKGTARAADYSVCRNIVKIATNLIPGLSGAQLHKLGTALGMFWPACTARRRPVNKPSRAF
ncbi:MAG TPA: hypothetical protein VLJ86_18965 [Ramlibacter sp.]|nr:hypothetical protein [Ramlibacter sp.]